MKKQKIIWGIFCYILSRILLIISLKFYNKSNEILFHLFAFFGTVPFSLCVLTFAKMLPKKFQFIKHLAYLYAFGAVIMFGLVCIMKIFGN